MHVLKDLKTLTEHKFSIMYYLTIGISKIDPLENLHSIVDSCRMLSRVSVAHCTVNSLTSTHFPNISEICDGLPKLENGNITCYEEEKRVNCSAELKAGAKAELECDPAYRFEREAAASREIKCKDDGTWSASPSKCIKSKSVISDNVF